MRRFAWVAVITLAIQFGGATPSLASPPGPSGHGDAKSAGHPSAHYLKPQAGRGDSVSRKGEPPSDPGKTPPSQGNKNNPGHGHKHFTDGGPAIESPDDPSADNRQDASREARHSGRAIRIAAMTTANSTTYANPDGSQTLLLHSGVVHVKDDQGDWADANPTLTSRSGRLRTAMTRGRSSFSPGGDRALGRSSEAGQTVGVDWPGNLPTPQVTGDQVTYPDVAKDTDLTVKSLATGYDINLVLSQPPASPPTYRLPVTVPAGWTVGSDGAGGYQFKDAAGNAQADISAATMYDAQSDASGKGNHTGTVTETLDTSGPTPVLVLSPDPGYLNDPATTYPVTIDPTYSSGGADAGDTYIDSQHPTTTYASAPTLEVGKHDANGNYNANGYEARAEIKFDHTALNGVDWTSIRTADLGLTGINSYAWNCNAVMHAYEIASVDGSWTWNNHPPYPPYGDYGNSSYGCEYTDQYFYGSILSLVQWWAHDGRTVDSLELRSSSAFLTFASANYGTGKDPWIRISYFTHPTAPQNVTATATNQQATVNWSAPADDGGKAISQYEIYTYTSDGTYVSGSYATVPGSTTSYTTPKNLTDGQGYYFVVAADNSVGWGPGAQSNTVTPTGVPNAPTAGLGSVCPSTSVTITWSPNGDNGSPITGYVISRWTASGSYIDNSGTLGPGLRAYTWNGLTPGDAYIFVVYAQNAVGTSQGGATPTVYCGLPDPPQDVNATGANQSATLTWNPPDNDGSPPVTQYVVTWYDHSVSDTTPVGSVDLDPSKRSTRADFLTNGDQYFFTIYAESGNGNGGTATSNTVLVADAPDQPTSVNAAENGGTHYGTTSATVSFTLGADNGSPTDECTVQAIEPASTTIDVSQTYTTGCASGSEQITGLAYGHTYQFRVAAHNGAPVSRNPDLGGTGWSDWGNSATLTTGRQATVNKTVTPANPDNAAQTGYDKGQSVLYTVTITNNNNDRSLNFQMIDPLPDGFNLGPAITAITKPPVVQTVSNMSGVGVCGSCTYQPPTDTTPATLKLAAIGTTPLLPGESIQYKIAGVLTDTASDGSAASRLCQALNNTVTETDDYAGNPDPNTGDMPVGPTTVSASKVTACNADLGTEAWWNYLSRSVGNQSTASVNVANGNLVVSSTDSTPVQAHGRLAFVLRRTYNSQDTTLETLPGSFGAGWLLNVGESDDLASVGVTGTALEVPSVQDAITAATDPLAVTLIDRDGTRHVFTPTLGLPGLSLQNGGLPASSVLRPRALTTTLDAGYSDVCLDTAYSAPPGVHLGLWRYLEVRSTAGTGNPCASYDTTLGTSTPPKILGYVAERPDRLRTEYDALGRLVDMSDGAGAELRYAYNSTGTGVGTGIGGGANALAYVYEPLPDSTGNPQCTTSTNNGLTSLSGPCRSVHFTYSSDGSEADVTDPAGRTTKYNFTTQGTVRYLTKVTNPDGSWVGYAYKDVGDYQGTDCGSAAAGQLCTITDERDHTTTFAYNGNANGDSALGLPRVTSLTNRRGYQTTIAYSDANSQPGDSTTVTEQAGGNGSDQANSDRQQVYGPIDADGRVWQLIEGAAGVTTSTALRTTQWTWDGATPDGRAATYCLSDLTNTNQQNNLCELKRLGSSNSGNSGTATADEDTSYVYDDAGMLQKQTQSAAGSTPDSLVTTFGYSRQYETADGTHQQADETVGDSGTVNPPTAPTPQDSAPVLYTLADKTAMVSPNGNAPGANPSAFKTTYLVDDSSGAEPNTYNPNATYCQDPANPVGNTGVICSTSQPYQDGSAVTTNTYDGHGQKLTATSANGYTTRYTYYTDADTDLSQHTSAGG